MIKRDLFGLYRDLPGGIYVLFFANIVNSLGNFVWPLLTFLLTDKLGMNMAQAGIFVTVATVAYVPGALIGGKLADHLGRKSIFLVSRVLAAACLVPCAYLGNSLAVPCLLIATCILNGASDPAITALVSDLAPSHQRQQAFSLLYLGHNLGFAIGPTLAGLLYRSHLNLIFIGDAATTLLSLVLVWRFVGETLPPREQQHEDLPEHERAVKGGLLKALLARPMLITFSLVMMVYSFVYVQHIFSLPPQMKMLFGPDNGPRFFGLVMSANGITVVLFTAAITYLTKRFASTWNIGLGGLLYAFGFGAYFFLSSLPLIILVTVLWTLGEILVTTNSRAYVADHTPITHRGRLNAAIDIFMGVGHGLGPCLMGRFITRYGVRPVWPVSFLLAFAASMVMFVLGGGDRVKGRDVSTPVSE